MYHDLMNEYLINDKVYIDVEGISMLLGKTIGTIRNMVNKKSFPEGIKRGKKLYFEKELIERYKTENEIVKIKTKDN